MWLSLLLWALSKVLEWLLTRPRLTTEQLLKLNTVIARSHRLEYQAITLGCIEGGFDNT